MKTEEALEAIVYLLKLYVEHELGRSVTLPEEKHVKRNKKKAR